MSNKFENTRLEFHIIQSFPVSCLNRDDVGAPKSAIIGGVERARVSSQCWKRAVRMDLKNLGVKIADRTKLVTAKVSEKCVALGAGKEQADACGNAVAKSLTKAVKNGESDTLFFISASEAEGFAQEFQKVNFETKISEKDLLKICKKSINFACDGLDIALFGRMVANAPELNIEAAASFAHAISTHKVASEVDFFTAVDDCKNDDVLADAGAGHMGSLEFNSATYYRYISLDLDQLAANLKTENIASPVDAFTKAIFRAFPAARQATMSAACPWDYAIVTIRKGQRMQIPFNTPVKISAGSDMVSESVSELKKRFDDIQRMYGSLFGLQKKFEIGIQSGNIDSLCKDISATLNDI